MCNILIYVPLPPDNNQLSPPDFVDYRTLSHKLPPLLLKTILWDGSYDPHLVGKNQSLREVMWFVPSCTEVPLLFNQSHLTSHSGSSHPHRSHMRKARKTFLALIYEQWGRPLLSQRADPSSAVFACSLWKQGMGSSLKKIGLTPKTRWQPADLLSTRNAWGTDQIMIKLYVYTLRDIYIYMNHKISVKTCLSQFILLKDKLRYITILRVYLSKNQFQLDSPQTEGVGVFHWQGHIQKVQKPIKECIWLAVA